MNLSKFIRLLLKLKKILIIFSLLIIHNNVANSATLINAAGGSTVHLREFLGDVQYFDNNTWNNISFPITLTSSSAGDVELNFASGSFAPTFIDYIINNILSGNRLNISYTSGGLPIQNDASIGLINNVFGSFINGSNFGSVISNNSDANISNITNAGSISGGNDAISNAGTISNLNNIGSISGLDAIWNNGTITNLINSGTISNTNTAGIYNFMGSITTLTNSVGGVISDGNLGAIFNDPAASIATFNNAQGGDSSSASKTALVYNGKLPTNYNIIIASPTNYGQLAWTDKNSNISAGSTNFGIYSGGVDGVEASTVSKGTYTAVLTNLTSSNIGATRSGIYSGLNWTLALQSGSSSIWDLIFSGASTADTQASLNTQSRRLRSTFNSTMASANFANMNTYDCNLFDQNNMCISAGGRYTSIDNPSSNNSAAVVVLGYKVSPNIRIGGFLDQSVNHNMPTGVDMSNKNPMVGAFAVWNHQADGLGFQMKLANAYLDKDVTTSRAVIGTSEAGRGRTDLNTQSYVGELSYAFNYQDSTIVRPYFALRYTNIKQDGYTEDTTASVTAPLTYAKLSDRSTTALMGVKLNHALTPRTNLTASLGVEQDINHKTDQLTASGVADLTSENFNNNIKRTRPAASAGAYYAVAKNQRLSGEVYYQQLPFHSTGSATAYFNYMIGF
jgi:Autotransporter beta-domain